MFVCDIVRFLIKDLAHELASDSGMLSSASSLQKGCEVMSFCVSWDIPDYTWSTGQSQSPCSARKRKSSCCIFRLPGFSSVQEKKKLMSADPCSCHSGDMGNFGCFSLPGLPSAFYTVINSKSWRPGRAFQSSQ